MRSEIVFPFSPVLVFVLLSSLFFFSSEGLFLTGTLGDYLMEVEHTGMSGISKKATVGGTETGGGRTTKGRGMDRQIDEEEEGRRFPGLCAIGPSNLLR